MMGTGAQIVLQIMMGAGLAASAGLRAWLPLLCAGLLARAGYLSLGESFAFLSRTDVLIVFGVATVLELLGDKIPVADHFLDLVGTVARPAAGTLLAASVATHFDPAIATLLGLIVGGGTALTIHSGKAVARAHATALLPLHGGTGNAALSVGEDAVSLGGVGLSVWAPVVAFVLVVVALAASIGLIRTALRRRAGRSRRSQGEA
jgi:Domain of unknown function (DUF4126)